MGLVKNVSKYNRLVSTVALAAVVLLATWMGAANGGYFIGDWTLVVFVLAAMMVVASVAGAFGGLSSWPLVAAGLFAGYAGWTCASLLWSPNRGDAWLGAGQTLLYLLAFVLTAALVASGASRRWALIASVLGPAAVAAFTLPSLTGGETFFEDGRLVGTVGYYNGEAAFLLLPFWVAVYLAGSRGVNPAARSLVLGGATLCAEVATLTQSRGALVAMAVSLPVFFVVSGQRLRGFLALIPVAVALLVSFPSLNEVYLAFLNEGDPSTALGGAVSIVLWTSAVVGLYGLLWAMVDRWWRPSAGAVRVFGIAVLIALGVASVFGAIAFGERVGNPATWTAERWEAFKHNDDTGQEQSRYLSASGSGRYTLWQVAWRDFADDPLLGVGTYNYEATYYQLRERPAGYVRQPHMLPLEVLAERGVVGGALFFGFLGACVAAGLRQRFKYLNVEGKGLVGAVVAAVAYWFVHSSAEWFWQLPAVTLPAIVYLAVLVTPWQRSRTEAPRWHLRVGVALAAVLVAAVVVPLYLADRSLTQSYAAADQLEALDDVERAQEFNPVDPQLRQREAELAIQIGDWPRVVRAYGEATRLNPEHYAPRVLLARFYDEQVGEPEQALAAYREALALNPLDEELEREVARLGESRIEIHRNWRATNWYSFWHSFRGRSLKRIVGTLLPQRPGPTRTPKPGSPSAAPARDSDTTDQYFGMP